MIIVVSLGEVSERFKELVLKTSDPERDRGFESHPLRQSNLFLPPVYTGLQLYSTICLSMEKYSSW